MDRLLALGIVVMLIVFTSILTLFVVTWNTEYASHVELREVTIGDTVCEVRVLMEGCVIARIENTGYCVKLPV